MKQIKLKSWLFLAAGSLLWIACQEDDRPAPDPCAEAQPFTAHFAIKEHVGDSLIETDRSLLYNNVTFEAPGGYQSYQWTIGEDDRTFTTSKVTLRFTEDAVGSIPVRLIAEGKPNPCVVGDNGMDTVEQVLQVIPWSQTPIVGRYQGAFASDPEGNTQVVEIRYISVEEDPSTEPFGGFELVNINKGCHLNRRSVFQMSRGARAMGFNAHEDFIDGCKGPAAWLKLNALDTLSVIYSYGELGNINRLEDQFTGIRIKE